MVKTPVKRFWNLLKQYHPELRQIYIYALLIGIVNLTLPLGIQAIINFLLTGELRSTWIILVSFVLVGIAVTGVLQLVQLRVVENVQQDLFARSAFEFAYRIPKISFLQFDKIHAPELVNRFFDTLTIQKGLPKILIDFSLAIFQVVFGLILLTIYSPYFVILGFVLALILWLIFKFTGPKGLKTSLAESKYKYELVHWLEEIARLNRSFKLNAQSDFHLNKTDGIVSSYLVSRESHFQVLLNQFRLFIGFRVIVAAGLLIMGGLLVFKEQMNIGQFVAAEIIIILILNSIEKVLKTIDTIYDLLTALEKIGNVTDLKLDENKGVTKLHAEKGLALRAVNIRFGFPDENYNIIDDLSIDVKSNEKIALTGKPGSGKSLLLQVLAGIHKIDDGEIYIDETPITSYYSNSLHEELGFSFATNQIFEGTFKENILMGRTVPESELTKVLEVLKLQNYIIHQHLGIDGFVDSGGRRLPRSVIQKILIARTIVNEPKLILMEDSLQYIDIKEKRDIIDYMISDERNWTLIVASDFSYWKEKCNRVIDLSKK